MSKLNTQKWLPLWPDKHCFVEITAWLVRPEWRSRQQRDDAVTTATGHHLDVDDSDVMVTARWCHVGEGEWAERNTEVQTTQKRWKALNVCVGRRWKEESMHIREHNDRCRNSNDSINSQIMMAKVQEKENGKSARGIKSYHQHTMTKFAPSAVDAG